MLQITIPAVECYNEATQEFITADKDCVLQLEHSLVSISKWESKWKKPFLSRYTEKTSEELIDYIRCMTITQNVRPDVYLSIPEKEIENVVNYIKDPMTATTFSNVSNGSKNNEIVTSELIYYWMTVFNIPCEYQKWHINRLLTLIEICSIKSQPSKKMSRNAIAKQNAAINAARRGRLHSKG